MDIKSYSFYTNLIALPYVEQIWLFGSRARGDHQERADIDLAIYCPKASLEDWIVIMDIIDNADTLLKIDCIRFDELKNTSPIKASIEREGIKLYDKSKN